MIFRESLLFTLLKSRNFNFRELDWSNLLQNSNWGANLFKNLGFKQFRYFMFWYLVFYGQNEKVKEKKWQIFDPPPLELETRFLNKILAPIIWILTKIAGDEIKSTHSSKIFFTLSKTQTEFSKVHSHVEILFKKDFSENY